MGPPPPGPPLPVGAFDLVEPAGQGGMGVVWRARHRLSGLPVAVKVLRRPVADDPAALELFRGEVRATAALDHPGIVLVLDQGTIPELPPRPGAPAPGSPFLAMEFAGGGSLSQSPLPRSWPSLRGLLLGLLDALAHAHARGVIHRDIKPGNVLLSGPDDARPGPKLTDFGIARLRSSNRGPEDLVQGSPSYIAPEQLAGQVERIGPWTDLFALGSLAWALCTGAPPYHAGSFEQALLLREQPRVPLRPRVPVPDGYEEWLSGLLELDPADRFQAAPDAAAALRDLDRRRRVPAPSPSRVRPPTPVSWTPAGLPATPSRLFAAGLGLFGLRRVPLVGREIEQDILWDALARVVSERRPRLVLLRGAEGTGKSALSRWLGERAEELGVARRVELLHSPRGGPTQGLGVLAARALDLEHLGDEAQLDALRVRVGRGGKPRDYLARAVAALLREELPDRDPPAGPSTSPATRLGASERQVVAGLALALAAEPRPLVLQLSGLQWGGESLGLIDHLLRRADSLDAPLLLLGTLRPDAVAPDSMEALQIEGLLRYPSAEVLDLRPLRGADVRTFVEQLLPLGPELIEQVAARADGNPAAAFRLVADWVEREELVATADGFVLRADPAEAPRDAREALEARLERALAAVDDPAAGRAALEVAAALGREVDLRSWSECCARLGAIVPQGLVGRLAEGGLIRATPRGFAFEDGTTGELLEQSARDGGRWPAACGAVADLLGRRRFADPLHLGSLLVSAGRRGEAVAPLVRGAFALVASGEGDRARALLAYVENLLDEVDEPEADEPRRLLAELLRCRILRMERNHREARRRLEPALLAARVAGEDALVARALRELSILVRGREPARGVEMAQEAVALLEGLGSPPEPTGGALQSLGYALREAGRQSEAPGAFERAAELFAEIEDWDGFVTSLGGAMDVLSDLGELDAADRIAGRIRDSLPAVGSLNARATALRDLATLENLRGRPEAALPLAREAVELRERLAAGSDLGGTWNSLGEVLRRLGRHDEAIEAYRRSEACFEELGSHLTFVPRVNRALSARARGDHAQARAVLEREARGMRGTGPQGVLPILLSLLLPCLALEGDWEAWAATLDRLDALPREGSRFDPDSLAALTEAAALAERAGRDRDAVRLRAVLSAAPPELHPDDSRG